VAAVVADGLPLPSQPQQAVTLLLSAVALVAVIRRVVCQQVTAVTLPLWVIPDMVAEKAVITVWVALEVAEAVAVEESTLVVEVVALKAMPEETVDLMVAAVVAAWEVLVANTVVEEAPHHGTGGLLVTEAQALTIMLAVALMLDRMPAEEAAAGMPAEEPEPGVEEVVIRGWCCFAINIKER
jgi:hypothetical protein